MIAKKEKSSKRIVCENLACVIVITIILLILVANSFCSSNWQKIGLIMQGIGLVLLSLWHVVMGHWGLQSVNRAYSKNISGMLYRFLPVFGLAFALAGLFFQF